MTENELRKLFERTDVLEKLYSVCEDVHAAGVGETEDGRPAFTVTSHSSRAMVGEQSITIDGMNIPVRIKKAPRGPRPLGTAEE